MNNYDQNKVHELTGKIRNTCLNELFSDHFPFRDHKLIMHPYEKHVNFRVIRAAIDAIIHETSAEVVPAITAVMNEIYERFAIPEVKYLIGFLKGDEIFDFSRKYALSDNKGPFKSSDIEKETLWMSYESYQIYNWICESISKDPEFLFNANLKGTEKDLNVQRLMKTSLTPELTFKYGVPKYSRSYNNTIYLIPLEISSGRALYEFRVIDRFIPRSSNENIKRGERITQGKLAYVPRIFGIQNAVINSIQMMGDGNEKGIYEILYEKGIFKKYWDMSIGFVWAATVGQRQIVEEQVAVAEDAKDRYLELNRHLENRVIERTAVIEKQKEEIEATNKELNNILDSLKMAQRKLIQSEKMASLGQLIAGIAHEINNPVNFISAGVDSLYTNLKDIKQVLDIYHRITPANVSMKLEEIANLKLKVEYREAINEINELIESIKNGTNRTTEIVKSLRTFSHLDDDILKTSNIHDGLDSTLILLQNKFKNRIEIIKHYGDIPLIKCYPGQLNQVFMNILSNAIDSIADKGIINISTSRKDNFVQIIIKDSGQGISEKNMSRIFDPFFTTKGIGKGMGLGLSISQSIIEKHNGMIEVNSEPGKGCEFIISIPLQQEEK